MADTRCHPLCPLCPLCEDERLLDLPAVRGRRYAECSACGLAFMRAEDQLDARAARAEYALHRNEVGDAGYRRFLDRLARPLCERLDAGASGLDYGCGPGPALVAMLRERGYDCQGWDPEFANDPRLLERRYDFVTCTEVAEHFSDPRREFERLHALLVPGGWLGLMTQWRQDARDFAQWRYVHDPTHVAFYRERSLRWIARWLDMEFHSPAPNLALFRRRS